MIERVHQHIITELQQNTRTDTIFILTAVFLNLLVLAINSAVAGESRMAVEESRQTVNLTIVMFIFVSLTIVVNLIAILGLLKGKGTRATLLNGLLKMYKDQGVEGYYDSSLLSNYNVRYNLFILAVIFTGLISIAVPFVIR
ncbi:hypothetical protein KAU37_08535 [Candidatus Bipolaricaulota bacterium]|nr:hypothetical protein [Candidatus Bipolaricaulota bacterium]